MGGVYLSQVVCTGRTSSRRGEPHVITAGGVFCGVPRPVLTTYNHACPTAAADVYSTLSKRFQEFQDKNKAAQYQRGVCALVCMCV